MNRFDALLKPEKADRDFEASFADEAIAGSERLASQLESQLQEIIDADPSELVSDPDRPHSGRLEMIGRETLEQRGRVAGALFETFRTVGIRGEDGRSFSVFLQESMMTLSSRADYEFPDGLQIHHADRKILFDAFSEKISNYQLDDDTTRYAKAAFEIAWSTRDRVHNFVEGLGLEDKKNFGVKVVKEVFGLEPQGRVRCIEQPYSISLQIDEIEDFVRARNSLLFQGPNAITDRATIDKIIATNYTQGFTRMANVNGKSFQIIVIYGGQQRLTPNQPDPRLVTFIHEGVHAELAAIENVEMIGDIETYQGVGRMLQWLGGVREGLEDDYNAAFSIALRLRNLRAHDESSVAQEKIDAIDQAADRIMAIQYSDKQPEVKAKRIELSAVYASRMVDTVYKDARSELLAHAVSGELHYAISRDEQRHGELEAREGGYDFFSTARPTAMTRLANSLNSTVLNPGRDAGRNLSADMIEAVSAAAQSERDEYFRIVREAGMTLFKVMEEGEISLSQLAAVDIRDWPEFFGKP